MNATIALAGNPNSGKTTLFNALTGAHQHVGNYPGITVEKKCGTFALNGKTFNIVDLPGTYSLTAYSLEEVVARDFLALEKPDMVVNIVDASNLQRNLYLSLQFMEMGLPVCIALNMMDVAQKRGISIDIKKLSDLLGVPVVATVARNGKKGTSELVETISNTLEYGHTYKPELKKGSPLIKISYGQDIDDALIKIEGIINDYSFLTDRYPARWTALKFLENDEQIVRLAQQHGDLLERVLPCDDCNCDPDSCNIFEQRSQRCDTVFIQKVAQVATKVTKHLKQTSGTYPEALIADHRYGYISSLLKQDIITHNYDKDRLQTSDKIDNVVTHRLFGPIIMVAVLYALYHFTFTYSELPVSWVEGLFGLIGSSLDSAMPDGQLKSLVISGIIDGVGGVLGFVPLIMFMFFFISILEDSGYLARVAFMLDRVFRVFGLHGSSVMPFIISGGIAGGCAVPGIMATRTLKSPKERLATLLTVPFMNCGAKLPVFILLIAAFFEQHRALLMFLITIAAWAGALFAAKLFRSTIIKGASTPFVMELPPYRLPTVKSVLIHTWERTWQYIKKAGTVILGISVVLWAMMTFPGLPESQITHFEKQRKSINMGQENMEAQLERLDIEQANLVLKNSIAGRIGSTMESITKFAGFDWRINIALLGGFAAKEVVVSTLGTAYSLGDIDPEEPTTLAQRLSKTPDFRPLNALTLILFTMFYAPCFVSVVCLAKESGSWKWSVFSVVFNTGFAFTLAVIMYQAGTFLGF
ncbi:MAG: ferrous iron transport protein B [Desulfamplus sp.]|nr:ferrous iron transport protein B [Desulfamplus sp.]